MDPTLKAFLSSWSLDLWVMTPLALTALVYVRGWRRLRRRGSQRFGRRQLCAFFGGAAGLLIALLSPIDLFSVLLLQMHMIQHLLLMLLVPPLIWLSDPELPLLFGLPQTVRRFWIQPLYRSKSVRAGFRFLVRPAVAWGLFVGTTWIWHVPQLYEAALKSELWHNLEHACFFYSAMLFWWPVVQPFPARPRYSRWVMLPYLFLAALQGTVLSGLFSFADRVFYAHYELVPRVWDVSALDDQAYAGALMWILGMLVYLMPAAWIGHQLLFAEQPNRRPTLIVAGALLRITGPAADSGTATTQRDFAGTLPLPVLQPAIHRPRAYSKSPSAQALGSVTATGHDLLRAPLLGRFLRWSHSRVVMQSVLFAMVGLIILDGLFGPQISPLNLAGVLPWIHWRGFLVLGLLVAGNLFCMACPFKLSRNLGKRWFGARRRWPRRLRSKWLAVALLILYFWAYEAFSLWQSPWWTAWIALGYFLSAFLIDGFFRGAAFCKYICPIGQFNFVQSLLSPFEVRVRDASVCSACTTKECIRGTEAVSEKHSIPGCELHLFQPRKSSNMDCTFCLDCIHACPHENVGILTTAPGVELMRDPRRSGLGQFGRRTDLAALVLVLVFAAFVNAAGMIAPTVDLEESLNARFGLTSRLPLVSAGCVLGLLVLPITLVSLATAAGRSWSNDPDRRLAIATRFTYMLVPIGFAMWLAHYSFHLFTSINSVTPAVGRLLANLGILSADALAWSCNCNAAADWLLRLEILTLDAGFLMSLYVGYRVATGRFTEMRQALGALVPWAMVTLLLFAAGVWIVLQPMQMRGTMQMGM